jgi:hypothetical protein
LSHIVSFTPIAASVLGLDSVWKYTPWSLSNSSINQVLLYDINFLKTWRFGYSGAWGLNYQYSRNWRMLYCRDSLINEVGCCSRERWASNDLCSKSTSFKQVHYWEKKESITKQRYWIEFFLCWLSCRFVFWTFVTTKKFVHCHLWFPFSLSNSIWTGTIHSHLPVFTSS